MNNEILIKENVYELSSNKDILKPINKIAKLVIDPENFDITISKMKVNNSPFYMYPYVCMFLGEAMDLLTEEVDWEEICYKYMIKIREGIYSNIPNMRASAFGGLTDIGFGVYSLYKSTGHYKKFIDSLNKAIITKVEANLEYYNNNLGNVVMAYYDTIVGLSGVAGYLLLFERDEMAVDCIKKILNYFIKLTDDIEISNYKVPGWYISSMNQPFEEQRLIYKNGNFNFGLAHGIAGPLVILSLAAKKGIEIPEQKEGIYKILSNFKEYKFTNRDGLVYWPGRLKFENYINKRVADDLNYRAGWCYGTPGIARAIYIAGSAINDEESINLSINAMENICKADRDYWMLDSPTICHGYAGFLAIMQAMYIDTNNIVFDTGRKRILKDLMSFYEEDSILGFYNIDPIDKIHGGGEVVKEGSMDLLYGATGVILTLISVSNPIKTQWFRHLLIQ